MELVQLQYYFDSENKHNAYLTTNSSIPTYIHFSFKPLIQDQNATKEVLNGFNY